MSVLATKTFRKRLLKTGLTVMCSALAGGLFVAEVLKRKASDNSLSLNLMRLPISHRELVTSFNNIEESPSTPSTFVSSAESLLPHIRKLKPNISTHHILRIQAASFLNKYYNELNKVLSLKASNNNLDFEEYGLHLRRRLNDMKLAFDFINFKSNEVSSNIINLLQFNKLDYARIGRDSERLRIAFDQIYNKYNNNDGENDGDIDGDDDKQSLLEHELMALYTHAPYLGEWNIFMKIANTLRDTYGVLEPIKINNKYLCNGHNDGINYNDLYYIINDNQLRMQQDDNDNDNDVLHTPTPSNLRFNMKPIESIQIKYNSYKILNSNNKYKLKKQLNNISSSWIELNNDNFNNNIIPLGIRRLGAVQKTISLTKCVKRVQGPILYHNNNIKMRGSVVLMLPKDNNKDNNDNNNLEIVPSDIPLISVNNFAKIKQIEEWDLKPEIEHNNTYNGKIIIRREPLNENNNDVDCFELEYDCILKLSNETDDYY